MGGLHHITEAYDSYLETELNESEKFGFKRTLIIKQQKKVSNSLIVNEVWEHETEDEADQKSLTKEDEVSPNSKKKLSINFNVGEQVQSEIHLEKDNSVSSGETLM
jgi:hypothetical protein